jgi:hypothetical protein
LFLRYVTSFGGLWQIMSPIAAPPYSAATPEAQQRADEVGSGVRALYSALMPAISLNPTPVYDNTFSVAGDVVGFYAAKGTGPDSSYTEAALTQSSGFMVTTAIATAGADSWWWDWNHVYWGPGMLNLLVVGDCVFSGGGPLPNRTDLRNIRVTLELDCDDLYLPAGARLMFHWQGADLSVANGGTGKTINFQWHEPLDIAFGSLGLGKGSPPHPNSGTGRMLNGAATVVIDFVPNDAFWRCIGTSVSRIDAYAFAPVERVMRAALTSGVASSYYNMQIQVVHPQQWGHADGAKNPPIERAYGTLKVSRWKIEVPV